MLIKSKIMKKYKNNYLCSHFITISTYITFIKTEKYLSTK